MRENRSGRREFLASVGRGMIVAGVGYGVAMDLGLTPAFAGEAPPDRLTFGPRERLVSLIEETPPDRLLPLVVGLLKQGTEVRELVGAAALANARVFGGEDYVGFHTFMALSPSYRMSKQLPTERSALPVLKVLYRNASRLAERGSAAGETLHPVEAAPAGSQRPCDAVRDAVHSRDLAAAEGAFASMAKASADDAWNGLMMTVQESPEVHRIVLAHRAWDMLDIVGREHAHTMLRQSLHYCVKNEDSSAKYFGPARGVLPKVMSEHKLEGRALGTRDVDDGWVERMSQTLFGATAEAAADAVAAALAEGISAAAVGEAISLAANQLVLRDSGRPASQAQANKPVGSVHGDSIGVHACDSVHAWRGVAAALNPLNAAASLVLAGYQVAHDRMSRGGDFLEWKPRPNPEQLEKVTSKDPAKLLGELDDVIREKNQEAACAVVHRYIELGHDPRGAFNVLLKYATSEDGALHAEKYYWTTSDEFARSRPAFRGRQLVALARVTASEYGTRAAGYEEACRLLGVS